MYSFCGFNEIIKPLKRYRIIDRESLKNYCGFTNITTFIMEYKQWIDRACNSAKLEKDMKWSESIAVGSHEFIDEIREKLDYRVLSRKAIEKKVYYI